MLVLCFGIFNLIHSIHSYRFESLRSSFSFELSLSKGFGGSIVGSLESQEIEEALTKTKLKSVLLESCRCGSGLPYSDCCYKLHSFTANENLDNENLTKITKARYAAYALGIPSYIIKTTHPTHRDFSIFLERSRDVKKAYKSWKKEIVTKNCEVFEFQCLDVISEENEVTNNKVSYKNISDKEIPPSEEVRDQGSDKCNGYVTFRVLVRNKADGKCFGFQEKSTYVLATPEDLKLELFAKIPQPPKWLYVRGDVTPVTVEEFQDMAQRAPIYHTQDTIKDRW